MSAAARWEWIRTSTTDDLQEGEKQTLENAAHGMMLRSGNDAAAAIARDISGYGNFDEFVARMNLRASQLGLEDTLYGETDSPAGAARGRRHLHAPGSDHALAVRLQGPAVRAGGEREVLRRVRRGRGRQRSLLLPRQAERQRLSGSRRLEGRQRRLLHRPGLRRLHRGRRSVLRRLRLSRRAGDPPRSRHDRGGIQQSG